MQTGGQRLHRLLESGKVPIRGGYGWTPTTKLFQTLRGR
nr:MAG TPA: hypothetical protein [Caudoviricetes sp.]